MDARTKKQIEKRNTLFKAATRAEKRVLIAKDIIAQLRAEYLQAKSDVYCNFNGAFTSDKDASVQEEILAKKAPACQVCPKGAIFISAVLYGNEFKVYQLLPDHSGEWADQFITESVATKYFTQKQLNLIESAFEGYSRDGSAAFQFYKKYHNGDDKKLLIEIMKNIIKNEGTFKP